MLAEAILVHGVIGYKFYWLLPFDDQNQGTPAGHESINQLDQIILAMKAFFSNSPWILHLDPPSSEKNKIEPLMLGDLVLQDMFG